jgi:hypothetical protein
MKTIKVPTKTVDMETGKTTKSGITDFKLMPPPKNVCQTCAVDHHPDQAHNAQSLYYQYAFYADHGRWPTWEDAVAHCPPEMKAMWEAHLRQLGVWPEPKKES